MGEIDFFTIQALVDFAKRGPRDTLPSAKCFTHASYAQHLFFQCGLPKFDYLFHHVPARIIAMKSLSDRTCLMDRIQKLLDSSFARITGITKSLEKHRHDNICTEVLLRLPTRSWINSATPLTSVQICIASIAPVPLKDLTSFLFTILLDTSRCSGTQTRRTFWARNIPPINSSTPQ